MRNFPLDDWQRAKAVRYLLLGWHPREIAEECRCSLQTIYNIRNNLWMYGTAIPPRDRVLGRPLRITKGAIAALLLWLLQYPIAMLSEMALFLSEEFGIRTSKSTISRALKRAQWSKKRARRVSDNLRYELRQNFMLEMRGVNAEQLIFLDEALFNNTTGWRATAWAPIGTAARYSASRNRGTSTSLLAAYNILGYLPCYVVKEGYFNADEFVEWLENDLLPLCNPFPGPNSVIILDNAGAHCPPAIVDAIHRRGCLVRHLPPYSPDYNPIELSFSVLKAWFRRNFDCLWPSFEGSFGEFILMAVRRSQCDRFAMKHFKHSSEGGYVFEGEVEEFMQCMRQYENGLGEAEWLANQVNAV